MHAAWCKAGYNLKTLFRTLNTFPKTACFNVAVFNQAWFCPLNRAVATHVAQPKGGGLTWPGDGLGGTPADSKKHRDFRRYIERCFMEAWLCMLWWSYIIYHVYIYIVIFCFTIISIYRFFDVHPNMNLKLVAFFCCSDGNLHWYHNKIYDRQFDDRKHHLRARISKTYLNYIGLTGSCIDTCIYYIHGFIYIYTYLYLPYATPASYSKAHSWTQLRLRSFLIPVSQCRKPSVAQRDSIFANPAAMSRQGFWEGGRVVWCLVVMNM